MKNIVYSGAGNACGKGEKREAHTTLFRFMAHWLEKVVRFDKSDAICESFPICVCVWGGGADNNENISP